MPVLKGGKSFYDYEITDILGDNLKQWLEYGLLEKGAYTIAKFNTSASGYCNLKRIIDDRYGSDKVFEGFGPSWVWQTDAANDIFQVSGVYVNNTFFPKNTSGAYSHNIDYKNGRIIFNNAIPASSGVKCEYVFKDVDVFTVESKKWAIITSEYQKRFDNEDLLAPSGLSAVLKENRVWTPCVVIETSITNMTGLQLGGGDLVNCEANYFIFGDNPFTNNRLCDILTAQYEKSLSLFDSNLTPKIYNFNGTLASGVSYRTLSDRQGSYFWTYATILDVHSTTSPSNTDVKVGNVRHNVQVQRYLSTY